MSSEYSFAHKKKTHSYWKLKASHEQTLIQFPPAHNSKDFYHVCQSIIFHIKSAQIWSELAMKLVHLLIWYLLILSGIHFRFSVDKKIEKIIKIIIIKKIPYLLHNNKMIVVLLNSYSLRLDTKILAFYIIFFKVFFNSHFLLFYFQFNSICFVFFSSNLIWKFIFCCINIMKLFLMLLLFEW